MTVTRPSGPVKWAASREGSAARARSLYWDMAHPRVRPPSTVLLAAVLVAAAVAAPATAQVSDYEMQYGQVVEVALDTILSMPESYVNKAVRTRGELDMLPGSLRVTYCLRGTFGARLVLTPTAEAGMNWEDLARTWVGKEVEVTGAIGMTSSATPLESGQPTVYMLLWGFLGPPDDKAKKSSSAPVTLEDLVTRPGKLDGKIVTVKGQFRGGNLFGDLPSSSRRRSSDWVIKEDLFAAWVTGKKPKGDGFAFDSELRRDTGKWLQVTGRVTTDRDIVTIEATDVQIAKAPSPATAAEAPAVAPPPPPPRPKRPPVVVFSLPLDGERDVPPSTVFQVQFSKDMDEASFKDRVVLRYAGRPQPGDRELDAVRITYDGGLRTLHIDPGDLLRPGRVVEVLLLPGIVDIDGLPLETRPGFKSGVAVDVLRWQTALPGLAVGP
jgi:hypothetical protein